MRRTSEQVERGLTRRTADQVERGKRGKFAEKEVLDFLARWNTSNAHFAFEKLADARAARGAIKAQISDFILQLGGRENPRFIILEVKETTHHFRIAKDKLAQLPRIRKWYHAGAEGVMLIYHRGLQGWRVVDLSTLELGVPSWDLRRYDLFDNAEGALNAYLGQV